MCLRKQAHYKARGSKCVQPIVVPHSYVRRTFFQAQMNVGFEPRKLIFGETDYPFFAECPVPACFLKYFLRRLLCQKSFTLSAVELTSTNRLSWRASHLVFVPCVRAGD